MGEAQTEELQLKIMVKEYNEANLSSENSSITVQQTRHQCKSISWWIKIIMYTFLVIAGQAVATLLGRLYFEKGGSSQWVATLVQIAGFPILLIAYYFIAISQKHNLNQENTVPNQSVSTPSFFTLAWVYVSLGLLIAANCYLYSVGLHNLPVSTYSLISASQLAFNALFSFFLNKQKITPVILNSIVILTISSTLLIFRHDSASHTTKLSKAKYAIGFICTVGASAGYGLALSLTQLAFTKVLKRETFKAIIDMIIFPSLVSSGVGVVGLFASKEWLNIKREMVDFEMGKVSYVMVLVWTAISWQLCSIGVIGLIIESSSLFSNAVSTLGLPVAPILAVIFFSDSMEGIKVIAMVLAMWGFLSFLYQHYLDDRKSKINSRNPIEVSEASSSNTRD